MTTITTPGVASLEASFERAAGNEPYLVHALRIGGHRVDLRFAGAAVPPYVLPAFGHLRAEAGTEAELVIDIWDSASTGNPAPVETGAWEDEPVGTFAFFGSPPVRGVYQPGFRALSLVDLEADRAWYWVEDAERLPYWERAAPLRQLLHWWMAQRGIQQVHAGAVGRPDGGVLLVGKGGSGKSTTSLLSLASELRYAADDYASVSVEPEPWVHSLYSSGKVHADNLHRVPHVANALFNGDRLESEKAVLFVDEHFPGRAIDGFPLKAIVIPVVTGDRDTSVVETSRVAALSALAPSTVFQLHNSGREAFASMAELVRCVPAFSIQLGSDLAQIPAALLSLLDDLGSGRR